MNLYCIYSAEAELYVKDSKTDTDDITEAKTFPDVIKARKFRNLYCDVKLFKPKIIEREE